MTSNSKTQPFADHTPLILPVCSSSPDPKGLFVFEGRTWLEEQFRRFAQAGGRRMVLVLDQNASAFYGAFAYLQSALELWIPIAELGFELAVLVDPSKQATLSTSVHVAARWLDSFQSKESLKACYVLPIDVPFPKKETWTSISDALAGGADVVIPRYRGRSGHVYGMGGACFRRISEAAIEWPTDLVDKMRGYTVKNLEVPDERVGLILNNAEDFTVFMRVQKFGSILNN